VAVLSQTHLLYFSSPRSGPSRRVEGYLDQVLQERRNHDAFARERIDVDASPELAQRYDVTVVPTILVVEDGRVLRRIEGRRSVSDLRGELSPWLR
jgi:thioredoxin-like negative regulator of GroEL